MEIEILEREQELKRRKTNNLNIHSVTISLLKLHTDRTPEKLNEIEELY